MDDHFLRLYYKLGIIIIIFLLITSLVLIYENSVSTINIYDRTGNLMSEYTGNIFIWSRSGERICFSYDGKMYTYGNCSYETIK